MKRETWEQKFARQRRDSRTRQRARHEADLAREEEQERLKVELGKMGAVTLRPMALARYVRCVDLARTYSARRPWHGVEDHPVFTDEDERAWWDSLQDAAVDAIACPADRSRDPVPKSLGIRGPIVTDLEDRDALLEELEQLAEGFRADLAQLPYDLEAQVWRIDALTWSRQDDIRHQLGDVERMCAAAVYVDPLEQARAGTGA